MIIDGRADISFPRLICAIAQPCRDKYPVMDFMAVQETQSDVYEVLGLILLLSTWFKRDLCRGATHV